MIKSKAQPDDRSVTEVFAELYEQNLPKVFRYIRYKVGDTQLAEDLTSRVFEKALTKFNKYQSDKASFSAWIMTIARNTVIDHYRVSAKRQSVALDEAMNIADKASPEEEAIRNEERQQLQLCLAQLPQQDQELISLKFGAELSNRQIAQTLGLSEANVGVKLYRAIRKLRNSFREGQNG